MLRKAGTVGNGGDRNSDLPSATAPNLDDTVSAPRTR
jgi:hypothetical protein